MPSVIIGLRWLEPCPGEDAKVACLTEAEIEEVGHAITWVRNMANDDWGDTIARVDLFDTKAYGGDLMTFKKALAYVATNVRYDTGEEIYDEDCDVFLRNGIDRS